MKQVFCAVAELLTQTARTRAELVLQAQATAAAPEDYRSNAGGWN